MKDNNYKLIIPKTYEQFLLETQSEEQTGENQRVAESFENEYEAEVVQGPQYGPGKKDFKDFAIKIKDSLGVNAVTGRISCSCDEYQPGKNYVGAIIYAIDGQFVWMNTGGDTAGRRGRSFYVVIKCTDGWPQEEVGRHPGMVHGYLIYKALGIDLRQANNRSRLCAGGFAYQPNKTPPLRINSGTLNTISSDVCQYDGSSALSYDEIEVLRYCWDQYTSRGTAHTFEMPFINDWVVGGGN